MKKHILTSKSFTGSVVFGYNAQNQLVMYSNESEMTTEQLDWMLSNMPVDGDALEAFKVKTKSSIQEVPDDISFDAFWEAYGKKINRKRCEPLFKRLKEGDKLMAIQAIKPYDDYLKGVAWRSKADPERWIRDELFKTDWRAELWGK